MKILRIALAIIGLLLYPLELFAADDRTLGFILGSTKEQAIIHAQSNGWELQPRLGDPNQSLWMVVGTNGVIEFCKSNVLSVTRTYEGGVDEFVVLEAKIRREILNGLPQTQIMQLRSNGKEISLIDAEFSAKDGSQTIVRLSSADRHVEVLSITWSRHACSTQID